MNVIVLAVHLDQASLEVGADRGEETAQGINGRAIKHSTAIFRHKDEVDMHLEEEFQGGARPVRL